MANKKNSKWSIKQLEYFLQDLDGFEAPKVKLEQYITPPHIAAVVLNEIHCVNDDIENKFIADLGCGSGMLTLGSIFCGARMVFGFDIDRAALDCALKNIGQMFGESDNDQDDVAEIAYRNCDKFNFIQANIASTGCDKFWDLWYKKFDTVIMNPPFGTKQNKGLDIAFLKRAVGLATGSVYSMHKTSTRHVSFIFKNNIVYFLNFSHSLNSATNKTSPTTFSLINVKVHFK